MARVSTLAFDRGTLILHLPPRGKAWVDFATWDDRGEKFRIPALKYRSLMGELEDAGTEVNDKARGFGVQSFEKDGARARLAHQAEALAAWIQGGRRGTVELPTGSAAGWITDAHRFTYRNLTGVPSTFMRNKLYGLTRRSWPLW